MHFSITGQLLSLATIFSIHKKIFDKMVNNSDTSLIYKFIKGHHNNEEEHIKVVDLLALVD